MLESGKFYRPTIFFVQHNEMFLKVGGELPTKILHTLIEINGVIIWENQGVFRLVPSHILRNLITQYETARSLNALYPRTKFPDNLLNITWDQGINISTVCETIKALLSTEESLGNSDTATDPTGEDHTDQP